MIHDTWLCLCHQKSPEAGSCNWILPKPKKVISILTKTHINHNQIHYTKNNWLGSSFSLLEIVIQKECYLCFIWDITEVDADPEGKFVSFKVTTSNEGFLFVPLQGIVPENRWLGGAFLKGYKITCKIKMREVKTK